MAIIQVIAVLVVVGVLIAIGVIAERRKNWNFDPTTGEWRDERGVYQGRF